jgi:uncharacterized protein (DUF2336 family)
VIVEAFLRWAETAKAGDRARAANALGRAFLGTTMPKAERAAAEMAMAYFLDDPSPKVRLSLAEALAHSPLAPRSVILSLAEDQPDIASQVILCSPVFAESDLIDLVNRGSAATHVLIASRGEVSTAVSAALVETGAEEEVICLLENAGASLSRLSMKRLAERFGDSSTVRSLLLERGDLPSDARHMLMQHVSVALANFRLVQSAIGESRLRHITREADEIATVAIAGAVPHEDIANLVEHLRISGRLTPAFLMHALCSGKVDFFAGVIVNLSGCDDRRVRSILGTGRMHAVRALYESACLPRDISVIFVEATMLWRNASKATRGTVLQNISSRLLQTFHNKRRTSNAAVELLDMVEKLNIAEQRQSARSFASQASLAAA